MAKSPEQSQQLKHFLLLVGFEGVDRDVVIERYGRSIHTSYMERYSEVGAFTLFVLRLVGEYQCAIRYMGPSESSAWLEREIQGATERAGGQANTVTLEVMQDITYTF